ncbi:MAG: DNA primase [Reichenbachiella sp.]
MLNDQTIEEIKNRMDIYEVVSDFVQLKKAGSSYKALSPFTDEKTPSFTVSPSRNIYKCFSTGKGGDAISFLMEIDGLSYIEALKYLAQKYAIVIEEEEESDEYKEAQSLRESLFIIMNFAKDHFVTNLWENDEGKNIGLSYFKERGFHEETIKAFDLGYSLDEWQGLKDAAIAKGHKDEFLEKAGLIIKKEDKAYDRFRGRVIFPVHNITGKVIAFGARTLKVHDKKSPKYLNSPETELYTKSKILYGIFQAKNEIRNQSNCYLVEGYTDVVSLAQAGIKNVVASSGTSLTDDQIKLIKRYTENVTVLFDGDKAGIKASMRGIDMMLAGGLNVKAVPFPDGEDPDSYASKLGEAEFKEYLSDNAKDFISFKTAIYLDDSPDPIKKASSIREIVQSIALIPDPIKRQVYLQECSTLLGMEEATLITEINKLLIQNRKDQPTTNNYPPLPIKDVEPVESKVSRSDIIEIQERETIRMLVNYGDQHLEKSDESSMHLVDYFISESDDIEFTSEVFARIFQIFKENLLQGNIVGLAYFLKHEDEDIRRVAIDLSTDKYELSPNWTDKYQIIVAHESDSLKSSAYSNILRLKFRIIQKMIADNMEKIKLAIEESEIDECLKIQGDLKEMEMSIAKELGNVTIK